MKSTQKLMNKGIGTEIYYPLPMHKQPLYQNLGYNDHLPGSEKAAGEVLSLPVYPSVTGLELKYIAECLIDCGHKHSTQGLFCKVFKINMT